MAAALSQSAGRAIDLLLAVAGSRKPLRLIDLAARLELDKSTCSRLLALLEQKALISREKGRAYQVGPAMVATASVVLRQRSLRRVARPFLVAIRDETGETATLHLRLRHERVCIDGVESASGLRRVVPLGETISLVNGISGRAMLARLADDEIAQLAATAHLRSDAVREIMHDVAVARREGFVTDRGDIEGIVTLATPIDAGPLGLAALSVSGPWDRWTVDKARAFGPRARAIAATIQHEMCAL